MEFSSALFLSRRRFPSGIALKGQLRDRKHHDSQRRDKILRFFSARKWAIFSTFWADFLTKSHTKPGERGKSPLEKIHTNPLMSTLTFRSGGAPLPRLTRMNSSGL